MTKRKANIFLEHVNNVMEEELESNECMFVESGAHQTMEQELGDLIVGDDVFQFDSETLEKDLYLGNQLNDVFGCLVVANTLYGLKNGSRSSFTNDEVSDPFVDLDLGNCGLQAPTRTQMHPLEVVVGSQNNMSQCNFNFKYLTTCSKNALHHSHILDGGGNNPHVSKPSSSLWIKMGIPYFKMIYIIFCLG